MVAPLAEYDRIFKAIRQNMTKITTANGYTSNVTLVDNSDDLIRPQDVDTGDVILITEGFEDPEFRTADFVDGNVTYNVVGWTRDDDTVTLRTKLRKFASEFWQQWRADLYLGVADSDLGGAGGRLVKEHRVVRIEREVHTPDAMFIAECRFSYEFSSTGT